MLERYALTGAPIINPGNIKKGKSLVINGQSIEDITAKTGDIKKFDLNNVYIFPALVNVHDHLRGDYLPRVGPKDDNFYVNWSYWDKDLKSSQVYSERANISVEDCYALGAYKNLFSGVITVNDHFPHEWNDEHIPHLPIRVITEYTLAHECSSYDLKWGEGIEIEHKRALENNYPFITHLEEGFDEESMRGIEILEELGCLDDHDVLIHCIGFSKEDIDKVKEAGAHVAWCPASNIFMFNVTCKIRDMIRKNLNLSIGTDSTHTGSINILAEMRYAREIYKKMYGQELSAKKITQMVTINPARAFRMDKKIGTIEKDKFADILIVEKLDDDPYESLLKTDIENIVLLTQEGDPVYGNPGFSELFNGRKVDFSEVSVKGQKKLVKGDPAGLLRRIREAVGFKKELEFLPLDDVE